MLGFKEVYDAISGKTYRESLFISKEWREVNDYVEEQILNADFEEAASGVEEYYNNGEIMTPERKHLMNYISEMKYIYCTRYKCNFEVWKQDLEKF